MSTCYIQELPIEVLKQIPTTYRQWKLLQLTCTTIYMLLRNLDERGIYYIENCRRELLYDEFVTELIDAMCKTNIHEFKDLFVSYNCVWGADERNRLRLPSSNEVIIWCGRSGQLEVYGNDGHMIQMLKKCGNYPKSYISIGVNRYIPMRPGSMSSFYRVIYNELPDLYSVMVKAKHLSLKDTDLGQS